MSGMDPETARALVGTPGARALRLGAALGDPDSLHAASRLRAEVGPALAAAALDQLSLRRRAAAKFGADAERWFFTAAGLEQASRPAVSAWRARRLAGHADALHDLGSGIGADSAAAGRLGLRLAPVEADEVTAILAEANLGVPVTAGDATRVPLDADAAVFVDPARRTARGRSWRLADLSPPWDFARGLLARAAPTCLKVGPGFPHREVPDTAEAVWVGHGGDAVELALWSGPGAEPGRRSVVLLGDAPAELTLGTGTPASTGPVAAYLFEPHPAAIAAGAVDDLAHAHGLHRLAGPIAYLAGDEPVDSPWLTRFAVRESMPWKEKTVRSWVRERGVGSLEIKKRGIDVDPAQLRRRLRPSGDAAATLVLTPTVDGSRALVVERAPSGWHSA